MQRSVTRELLDELPAHAPGAVGSRRDLRRLNTWMGNARTLAQALRSFPIAKAGPVRLVELGAGDGDLLLKVARRLGDDWRGTEATLVDIQDLLSSETRNGFYQAGWKISVTKADAFDWSRSMCGNSPQVVLANLFLHHFQPKELQDLLCRLRQSSDFLVAVEPRRSVLSLIFSRLVRFIGCNSVTQHDAPASVCAGFAGNELSMIWGGTDEDWQISERRAGPFGHLFVARNKSPKRAIAATL